MSQFSPLTSLLSRAPWSTITPDALLQDLLRGDFVWRLEENHFMVRRLTWGLNSCHITFAELDALDADVVGLLKDSAATGTSLMNGILLRRTYADVLSRPWRCQLSVKDKPTQTFVIAGVSTSRSSQTPDAPFESRNVKLTVMVREENDGKPRWVNTARYYLHQLHTELNQVAPGWRDRLTLAQTLSVDDTTLGDTLFGKTKGPTPLALPDAMVDAP